MLIVKELGEIATSFLMLFHTTRGGSKRSEIHNATGESNQDVHFSLSFDHATRFARRLMLFHTIR